MIGIDQAAAHHEFLRAEHSAGEVIIAGILTPLSLRAVENHAQTVITVLSADIFEWYAPRASTAPHLISAPLR